MGYAEQERLLSIDPDKLKALHDEIAELQEKLRIAVESLEWAKCFLFQMGINAPPVDDALQKLKGDK